VGLFDPFNLLELELHRRRAAENGHADFHAPLFEIQFLDRRPLHAPERVGTRLASFEEEMPRFFVVTYDDRRTFTASRLRVFA
jgi:hypothetical protein